MIIIDSYEWNGVNTGDLKTGHSLGNISHESKIDWLEMNETGSKLLFRDQRLRLYIVDIEASTKTLLLGEQGDPKRIPRIFLVFFLSFLCF